MIIYGCFLTKDMHTPALRSGHLYIKDAKCVETKEISYLRIFRYLVFELLASKRSQKMHLQLNFLRTKIEPGSWELNFTAYIALVKQLASLCR